jgi:hypothetical protein
LNNFTNNSWKWPLTTSKRRRQALARFFVQFVDATAQLFDGLNVRSSRSRKIVPSSVSSSSASGFGLQVDWADLVAFADDISLSVPFSGSSAGRLLLVAETLRLLQMLFQILDRLLFKLLPKMLVPRYCSSCS